MTNINDLSINITNVINTLENDPEINSLDIPISDPGLQYNGTTDSSIIFDGRNSFSKLSQVKKFEWDLNGDGNFSDAIGPIVSYNYDKFFNGFIGLKVTNDFGYSDIGYSQINITSNPNIFNNISFQPDPSVDLHVNNSSIFKVTGSNQFIKSMEWYLDDKLISSGNSFNYLPDKDDLGVHIITSKVSFVNDPRTLVHSWIVGVQLPDNDGDLWNSNLDCDDNNHDVNPNVMEIKYNGIDDDCNPNTLDNNTAPVTQNKTQLALQNQNTQISLQATDPDPDQLTFIIVDKPKFGTLTNPTNPTKSGNIYSSQVTYRGNPDFHDIDKFTYIVNDGEENSTLATVQVNVGVLTSPATNPPTKPITINEDTITEIPLSGISPDGHPLNFSIPTDSPTMGIFKNLHSTGPNSANISYIPVENFNNQQPGFSGDALLRYIVKDGNSIPGWEGREKGEGFIIIKVLPVNDLPIPFDNLASTTSDTPVEVYLWGSDADNDISLGRDIPYNHGLNFEIVDPPSHGSLGQIIKEQVTSTTTKDKITYTPDPGFTGKDSFTFRVSDGQSQSIDNGNMTIIVSEPSSDPNPEFESGDLIVTTDRDSILWYKSDGTFIKRLTDNVPGYGTLGFDRIVHLAGGELDSKNNLYITEFGKIRILGPFSGHWGISKWDKTGNFVEGWRDGFECGFNNGPLRCTHPESITIDKNDNLYVGAVAGALGSDLDPANDYLNDVKKFDVNGTLLDRYDVDTEDSGSDLVALGADQCTLYYTSQGKFVKSYDVCKKTQLPDFGDVFPYNRLTTYQASGIKLLSDGGMLVANQDDIVPIR